jgi:hypothetical protein
MIMFRAATADVTDLDVHFDQVDASVGDYE